MDNEGKRYHEKQKDEFILLQSMFDKDIKDLRPNDSRKTLYPPEFVITLTPQVSASGNRDTNTQVDLHVKFPVRYPDIVPELCIKNPKGISSTTVEKLQKLLEDEAKRLRGEVMIHDLTMVVQKFLYKNIVPHYGSFYEEMICNRKKREEEEAKRAHEQNEIEKQKQENLRKEIEEAISRKKEECRLEVKSCKSVEIKDGTMTNYCLLKTHEISSVTAIQYPQGCTNKTMLKQGQRSNSNSENLLNQCACDCEYKPKEIRFNNNKGERVIQRGKCLGHSSRGKIVYSACDTNTGELVVVLEWTFNLMKDGKKSSWQSLDNYHKTNENLYKQLASIEQEFSSLNRLQHKNLVHYLGIKRYQEKDKIVIAVLQEFALGVNLEWHLSKNVPVELHQLRHYMSGILEGLSYLHKNSVVHKDLRGSSIFLENDGLVKLADYSLERRLTELYYTERNETFEDTYPLSVGRGGKKTDVYRLGILCLSLTKGVLVSTMFPDIPTAFPGVLQDFLKRCLTTQDRWCVDQLINHSFINQIDMEDFYCANETKHKEVEENCKTEVNGQENEVEFGDSKRHARLKEEFKILEFLGSGGFGKVLKVRNKLDGSIYAIKSIALNPDSKLLRKMTREVKLLSKLNHENVVRYYNSWLEASPVEESELTSSSDTSSYTDSISHQTRIKHPDYSKKDTIDCAMQQNLESSTSILFEYSSKQHDIDAISSDEEEEEEEDEDIFGTSFLPKLNDSGHICSASTGKTTSSYSVDVGKTDRNELKSQHMGVKMVQFIYIQMEFCDKSTLREVIDKSELYTDKPRVQRLFREIVEGLAHIHQQGMIHRDLKPGNIFLDSHDHVKIGDFGLATSTWSHGDSHHMHPFSASEVLDTEISHSDGMLDGSLTGQVGTLMYISPEVKNLTTLSYNQKVDIYSLGIVLFEMNYPALRTAMEKAIVIGNLRKPEIILPKDFTEPDLIELIKWLLNHDPTERPTSEELLQSDYLPPPQMEEAELQDMLRHTITNPQSKAFKYMIYSLFNQETSTAADVTYDMDLLKGTFSSKTTVTYKFVIDRMIKVFEVHGALCVSCPLLMPKFKLNESQQYVNLIDHSGSVVCLPYDLHVPFCRFVVKNKVASLKRYHISPVYRERKVYGCHPRSLYECAFDIVTPTPGNLIADAEVLHVIMEIVDQFKTLQNRHCIINLNHTSLLKGILVHFGIEERKHDHIYNVLKEARIEGLTMYQRNVKLINDLNLTEEGQVTTLTHWLNDAEGTIDKMVNLVKPFTKQKGKAASMIKCGIQQLETVIEHTKILGLKASIVITPDLVHNIQHMSGIMFQFSCELKKKRRKEGLDILAIGGRYDQLITSMRLEMGDPDLRQSVVGVSIAVEKLIYTLLQSEEFHIPGSFDVFVCALGHHSCFKDIILVIRELWDAGISSYLHHECLDTLEDIQETSAEFHASYMVILKESEAGSVRVRWWDKEKYIEKKMFTSELVDFLIQKGLNNKNDIQERMESRLERSNSENMGISTNFNYNITYQTMDKLQPLLKKRHEGQIKTRLNQVLQNFSTKFTVEVIAVELPYQVIVDITVHLKIDGNESVFQNSIHAVTEKNAKHRKLLKKVCENIWYLKYEKKQPVIILYGLSDGNYKVLM